MGQGENRLARFAWLLIGTAVVTIILKIGAYFLTGSVGLLSDALESGVNLATAVFALIVLTVAAQPPDAEHAYGHDKAEYFSSGAEGTLILVAALTIAFSAGQSLLAPQPLEQLGLGMVVSLVAALCNWVTARILLRVGRQYHSVTLRASAHHLLADVWTSVGVVAGIGAVSLTGWQPLDSLIALGVALLLLRSGIRLVQDAINGLMDVSLPQDEIIQVLDILAHYRAKGVAYHALRTRRSGARRFVSVHIQVPGAWSVQEGHALLEEIEHDLRQQLNPVSILTHLEPIEDPVSWQDIPLNRTE